MFYQSIIIYSFAALLWIIWSLRRHPLNQTMTKFVRRAELRPNFSQTLFNAEMWISALNIVISLKKVAWINRPSPESNPLKVNRRFAQNPNATRAHERTSRRNLICSRFVTFRPIVINMNLCDTAKPVSEFPDANWICVGFSDFFETVFRARLAWPENIRVYDCERRQEM